MGSCSVAALLTLELRWLGFRMNRKTTPGNRTNFGTNCNGSRFGLLLNGLATLADLVDKVNLLIGREGFASLTIFSTPSSSPDPALADHIEPIPAHASAGAPSAAGWVPRTSLFESFAGSVVDPRRVPCPGRTSSRRPTSLRRPSDGKRLLDGLFAVPDRLEDPDH